jgi:hypothetical protein
MNSQHDETLSLASAVQPEVPVVTGDVSIDALLYAAGRHLDATSTVTAMDPVDIIERIFHEERQPKGPESAPGAATGGNDTVNAAPAVAELLEDMKALRRGRGILDRRIDDRIGRALRLTCGVPEDSSPADAQRMVSARLTELANQLPHDLRNAVLAAFALLPDTRQRSYQERVRWVADRLERDERTAQRRINEGLTHLAELAAAYPRHPERPHVRMPSRRTVPTDGAQPTIRRSPTAARDETSPPQDLTAREQRVLAVIRDYLGRYGYPPSVREIGEALGLTSASSVARLLRALERKGYLHRDPNRPRAVGIPATKADPPYRR